MAKYHKVPDGEVRERSRQLRELQGLPLAEKVARSQGLIGEALAKGKAAVLWSGGKDSTVLLHLARAFQPDIPVVYNDTGVEYPETRKFVRELAGAWGLAHHVAKPKPGVSFWWCIEKYGYPLFGKGIRQSDSQHFVHGASGRQRKAAEVARMSSYCCDWLKEKPTWAVLRELGVEVQLLGTMVAESRQRWFTWVDYGELHLSTRPSRPLWKATPLYFWRDEDVWEYHRAFGLPHCSLYDMGHKRNGCWPCGMDIAFPGNNLSALRLSHPKMWRFLMVEKGLGEVLLRIKLRLREGQSDLFMDGRVAGIIEQRPCYFDNLEGV